MLVAAAVCPHPPLLVPQLASGAAAQLDALRAACDEVVATVLAAGVDEVVVVGADPGAGSPPDRTAGSCSDLPTGSSGRAYDERAGASMRPYGVDVRVGGPGAALPLSLAIGAWLLDRSETAVPRRYVGVDPAATTSACVELGASLVSGPRRTGLLVLGDGSSRRTDASPGRFDERATGVDDAVVSALAAGDAAALLALDAQLGADLVLAGRAAWQVLAGAAGAAAPDRAPAGTASGADDPRSPAPLHARVVHADAPYGVLYVVACWLVTDQSS